jgi:pyruvate kinase
MRKTKIIGTIGPNFCSYDNLKSLFNAGMDAVRLNFSHGDYAFFKQVITLIRNLAQELNKNIVIIQDLCGPKIRVGEIKPGGLTLTKDDIITVYPEGYELENALEKIVISFAELSQSVKPGNRILLDDGNLELEVVALEPPLVQCRVITGGVLTSHKGVNLPGADLKISALTPKDRSDLEFGLAQGVDWVALSFVRQAEDIKELKTLMQQLGRQVPILAKIEKAEGVENLNEILFESDGILVARGDMGVELPLEEVPVIQKRIIDKCNREAKPVITATQMLDSMQEHPRPTRAEVEDIATAIWEGSDALMLSGETASGKYPLQAVEVMARVAEYAEQDMPPLNYKFKPAANNVLEALSRATYEISESLKAAAIVVSTSSGRSAMVISKFKTKAPIIALTEVPETLKTLALSWGVFPILVPEEPDTESFLKTIEAELISRAYAQAGDLIVITAGVPVGVSGSTDMVKIQVLGHNFLRGIGIGDKLHIKGTLKTLDQDFGANDILLLEKLDDGLIKQACQAGGLVIISGEKGSEIEKLCSKCGLNAIIGVASGANLLPGRQVELDLARGLVIF